MKLFPKLLLYLLLTTLVVAAKADEPAPWKGILCSSQAQTEAVVTRGVELGGAMQGIEAVNLTEPDACTYAVVIGIRGPPLKTIDSPDGLLDVLPILIIAVMTPQGLVAVEPVTRFTLAGSEARGA